MERRSFFARFAWPILFAFALVAPLLFWGAGRAVLSNSNKVEDWLPRTYRETTELGWFRGHFEADQFVVLSWEGCRLGGDPSDPAAAPDDPRIQKLAQILRAEVPEGEGPGAAKTYFKSVTTARHVLRQLTEPPSDVPYEEAVRRLQGALIGPDGRQTCVLVTLTLDAIHDLRGAIGRGRDGVFRDLPPGALWQAVRQAGIDPDSVHVGGPPVDNVAIDEEGERTLVRLAGLSGVVGLVLAWWSLRSIGLTLIVFACGILSAALGLSAVWFTGSSADAVLMSMPSLVYVLAISGAVHLINYYREAIAEGGLIGAVERAIAHGWKPALLCSITTAVGLASLYASDLVPIRKFGVYSAAGVMSMLLVLFLFLPSALQVWPIRRLASRHADAKPRIKGSFEAEDTSRFGPQWARLAQGIIGHHRSVMIGCLLVIGAVGYGVSRVHTSVDLLKLFDRDARIIEDYAWLEEHLGRLVPMEIVLRFPPATQEWDDLRQRMTIDGTAELSFLERMETVSLAQEMIESHFGPEGRNVIGATMSAATFGPVLPRSDGGTAEFARRTITNKRLAESRDAFLKSGYLQVEDDDTELWRISVRVAAFQNVDYGRFAAELKQAIEPVLAAHQFRSRVLRAITAGREDGTTAGASVLLWRPPAPASRDASPVDPPKILGTALGDMLANMNVNVLSLDADPGKAGDKQLDKLRALGCVVLLGDFTDAQVESITEHGVRIVDARPQALDQLVQGNVAGGELSQRISAVYTGVVPIVYKAQRALLESLIDSTMYSFLTITPLMMFVTRSIPAGLVVMLPNVLPVLVVFGGMGWLGISVDIGSMMSASIALGVAVDDTIHFLAWYRDDLRRLGDRQQAIKAAYRKCATPTLQAALISGLGLSVFAFSTFTPTQRFGWLMLTILVAGMVAELVMLPALLAGPMGRVFRVKRREQDTQNGQFRTPHAFAQRAEFRGEEIAKRAAGG